MHALILEGVHQPLQFREVPDLVPGPGEAVVALRAAALNHRDLWIQKGQYAGLKFPIVLGSDGAGVIESLGEGANAGLPGQEVILNPSLDWGDRQGTQGPKFRILGLPDDGTFATHVRVPATNLVPKPAHLDWRTAAALPLAGLTAFRALFHRARLARGERLLVTGVGGGAALFALQFGVAAGASVFVTSGSDEKVARAVSLGAAGGVNYKQENWADALREMAGGKASGGFDVILDSAGGEGFAKLVDLAAPGGRIVFFGATTGNPPGLDMRKTFWKQLTLCGSTMGSPEDFAAMTHFVDEHRLTPLAEHVFPLAEGNAALAAMERAEQFGKIVLEVG